MNNATVAQRIGGIAVTAVSVSGYGRVADEVKPGRHGLPEQVCMRREASIDDRDRDSGPCRPNRPGRRNIRPRLFSVFTFDNGLKFIR